MRPTNPPMKPRMNRPIASPFDARSNRAATSPIQLAACAALVATAASVASAQSAAGGGAGLANAATATNDGADSNARSADDASLLVAPVVRPATLVRPVDGTAAAGPNRPRLEIVDAGREDVGPLGTSLRSDPVDQRLPTGFERVYRVPGSSTLLMRGNGALFAVFEESVYRRSGAALPPGTVFHIGMPDHRPPAFGLEHAPADARSSGDAAAGRRGVISPTPINSSPIDRRIRPTRPQALGFDSAHASAASHTEVVAPITLESVFGIAPRDPVETSNPLGTEPSVAAIEGAASDFDDFLAGTSTASASADAVRSADAAASSARDIYAHLKLGPARIARAD